MDVEPFLNTETLEMKLRALTITALTDLVGGIDDVFNLVEEMTSTSAFRMGAGWLQFEKLDVKQLTDSERIQPTLYLKLNPIFLRIGGEMNKLNELEWAVRFPSITADDAHLMSTVDWLAEAEIIVGKAVDAERALQSLGQVFERIGL
jgi:hypothetical protein